MDLKVGDEFPKGVVFDYVPAPAPDQQGCGIPIQLNMDTEVKDKTIVLVAVPGAFTPTCSANHIPPYIANQASLKAAGVDSVIVLAANDPFVMNGWARDLKAPLDYFKFANDKNLGFTSQHGLSVDLTSRGMGVRTQRFAMIIKNGIITYIGVEPAPGVSNSGFEAIKSRL